MARKNRKNYKLGDCMFVHISKKAKQELVDYINSKDNISDYVLELIASDMQNKELDNKLEIMIEEKLKKILYNETTIVSNNNNKVKNEELRKVIMEEVKFD